MKQHHVITQRSLLAVVCTSVFLSACVSQPKTDVMQQQELKAPSISARQLPTPPSLERITDELRPPVEEALKR